MPDDQIPPEIVRLIANAKRLAHRVGKEFVVDDAKLRDFRTALQNRRRRKQRDNP
jgi:hypothetical protein